MFGRNRVVGWVAVTALAVSLTACESGHGNEAGGTIGGAVLGAVVGNAIEGGHGRHGGNSGVGLVLGAMVGAMVGNSIGKKLDDADRDRMARAGQTAFETYPSGRTATWVNPDTGHRGDWTPQPAYQDRSGRYCREYTQTIEIGGERQQGHGTACRQPDGSWKIVSTD